MAGNADSGRKAEKPFRDALRIELAALKDDDQKGLRAIARKLIALAESGDMQAIKELGDRTDGKPAQAIIGGDEDDAPINVTLDAERFTRAIAGLAARGGESGEAG